MLLSILRALSLSVVVCLVSPVLAQDGKKEAPPASPKKDQPAEKPADPPTAEPKKTSEPKETAAKPEAAEAKSAAQPAGKTPAGNAAGAEAFALDMLQWRQVITKMRSLQKPGATAEGDAAVELQKQWDTLSAQADALLPQMRKNGVAAYIAAPNLDRRLSRFLVKLLQDDVKQDAYERALDLGETLIKGQSTVREIYDQTGLAAYSMHDFEKASTLLLQAQDLDSLSEDGQKALESIEEYGELWKAELAIRKKEAEADDLPRVKLTTNKGEMVLELFENEAPETVGNFVSLVEGGFYDNVTFHRVLPGFMAQGGCPDGNGQGGPGYKIYCETERDDARMHFRGSLSMAHAGKDTGGSQFFTTFRPTPFLNKRHTVFGRVIEGLDVLSKIQRRDPSGPNPAPADLIVKAEVIRKREHDYAANKVQ